jgi:hypothetical protein
MHFSEDDLRAALARKDPGPEFTKRLMAKVNQAEKKALAAPPARSWLDWLRPVRLRPALAGASAIVVLLAAGGLGYMRHVQLERQRQRDLALAKEAEQQAILALRITNAKLNRVFQRVRESQQQNESKIRREKL